MSAYGMKPAFKDRESYLLWRREWRIIYRRLSHDIQQGKRQLRVMQGDANPAAAKWHKELTQQRAMAWKMMTLLSEAKLRRDKIIGMVDGLRKAKAQYPLALAGCRYIDFYFNKGHLEFPFLPMWIVKTKGMTFYVEHVEATVAWSTKETPDNTHTKGAIRLRNCSLSIDMDGEAIIH